MKVLGTVLIVDDEAYVRDSLADVLERRGFRVRTAGSVTEALAPEALAGLDAVVTDLKMPGGDGRELVRRLAEEEPALPVVVLTAYGTVGSAVECMKAGAFDYLLKPTDPAELALVLERALGRSKLRRELDYLRAKRDGRRPRERPLGVSAAWQRLLELAETTAASDTSALILGESGTGKEVVAQYLHDLSLRSSAAFVRVNCAAIPAELFESEFFGHRRGAFTGAVADREGRFRIADGGTLFLDEINAMPEAAQAKVLRVLQDGTFERVGDSRPTTVDVRLICASNVDLGAEVEAGRFRADLFYRIAVMTLEVPPLRERPEDVRVLAEAFLEEFAARLGKPIAGIEPATMEALRAYRWPGNVRELRNVLERGVLLEKGESLGPASLPFTGGPAAGDPARSGAEERGAGGEELHLRRALAATERRTLERALEHAGGVRREAARLLGVDERNLAYYLKKHGLMERGKR